MKINFTFTKLKMKHVVHKYFILEDDDFKNDII